MSTGALELIIDGGLPGAENMRRDLEMLERVAAEGWPGAVRLYGFSPPCLSLGRLQDDAEIDRAACARDGIDVVRRPTGGRAVLHDAEVTYAVACRVGDPDLGGDVSSSCSRIHAAVSRGLRALGVETASRAPEWRGVGTGGPRRADPDCFNHVASHELLDADGRKLVGSAQARRAGGLLQHGSVLLEPPRTGRYLSGGAATATGASASRGIVALLGARVSREDVTAALATGFRELLGERLAAGAEVGSRAPDGDGGDHIGQI